MSTATTGDRAQSGTIRKLFDDAAACGDRYHCPPLEELARRAEEKDDRQVLAVAFDLMCDAQVQSASRLGDAAWKVARAWLHGRDKVNGFDAGARQLFLDGIRRILSGGSPSFIIPAYSLLQGRDLSEAPEIFKTEALNPQRDDVQRSEAVKSLHFYLKDLVLARTWLSSKDPRMMDAGARLLDNLDHSLLKQTEEELPLLLATARRADLPKPVALMLVAHVASHEDQAFLPVLKVFAQSRDAEVHADAKEAIEKVQQAEAARQGQGQGQGQRK